MTNDPQRKAMLGLAQRCEEVLGPKPMRSFLERRWSERGIQEQSWIVAGCFIGAGASLMTLGVTLVGFHG